MSKEISKLLNGSSSIFHGWYSYVGLDKSCIYLAIVKEKLPWQPI